MPESNIHRRLPELDFWRGVAIASVLLYHAIYWTQPSQPGRIADWITRTTVFGWLGVNLFFVLSGFLITGILLDTKGKSGYFRSFYARRVRRIIPAYALCLVLLILVSWVSAGGVLRAITFTANYDFIPAARAYAPLWSLSVEEQFYLIWPVVVLCTNRRTLTAICVAICISEPLVRYFAWTQGPDQFAGLIHEGTLFVADSLAIGALGALYFRSAQVRRNSTILLTSSLAIASCIIFFIGYPHGLLHRTHAAGAALQVVPFNLCFAAAIFASVAFRPRLLGAGITRPVRALGDISYGLYLYHLIVFGIYDRVFPAGSYKGRFGALLIRALVCFSVSIAFAWVSRWKFEEIFLTKKSKVGARTLSTIQLPLEDSEMFSERRPLRVAYFVSHPIQYQAPLLRRIAEEEDIDLKVFFSSNISVRGYRDRGFGVPVKWDIPLLEGYKHEFLPVLKDAERVGPLAPINIGIRRILRKQKFDAVWVHGYNTLTNLQVILAAHSMRLPVLVRAESTLTDRPRSRKTLVAKRIFFQWLRKRVSAALAIGESNTAYWRHYLGEGFPIFPCPYTVDNEFFQRECNHAAQTREEFRRSLGLDPRRPVILFASKLQTRKRCIDLLDAYLQVAKSSPSERVPYLLIVGDGEEREALEIRAQEAAPESVKFLGFRNQTELPRFYDLCNVFVLVSVHEPWGLVVNEVMNAGRPVIVSDQVGCHKDLVQNGVNGYVVKAYDTKGLAESLQDVLGSDGKWQAMGAQSLQIVRSYSFDENVSGLRHALQHAVPGFAASRDGLGSVALHLSPVLGGSSDF